MRIFMVFIGLVVAGDQPVHGVGIGGALLAGFNVGNSDAYGDEIGIDCAARQKRRSESDGAGEIAQAVGDVIGSTEDPVGAGKHQAFHSARASDAGVGSGTGHIIRRADDAIGSGAEQWLGSAQEDSAVGEVVDGREWLLLAVAGSVDAFQGIERLVARDEILLRGFGGADRGNESRHQREQADGHNDDSGQEFDQRETAFPCMSADELFFLHHCCTQIQAPAC